MSFQKRIINQNYMQAAAITASDTVGFAECDAIYIGGAGSAAIVDSTGTATTFPGLLAGTVLPLRACRVNATGLTATNLVALYSDPAASV